LGRNPEEPTNILFADYCNIRGGQDLIYIVDPSFVEINSLQDANPMFVDPSRGMYQLQVSSPCIDAGDPSTKWNDVNFPPSRGSVRNDMGAYGWQASVQSFQDGTLPAVNISPSNNRNYIHTIMPQVEVTSIPYEARSPSQYMESIEYFDGLGRPLQSVSVGASPNGKDIVTPIAYDAFGREDKKYLPYEAASGTGRMP
jgi:hypothetical protein